MTAVPQSRAALVVPYGYAILLPLLPLLIEVADVLPRGVAVVGKGFAVALGAAAAAMIAIGLAGAARSYGFRALFRTPLTPAFVALVSTAVIAAIAGLSWRAGVFEVASEIGDALAFFAILLTLRDERARRIFLGLFFASGILACVFAVSLTLSRHPPAAFAYEHGRAAGTFLQPNEFAGYLLFLIPLGVAQWASPPLLRRLGLAAAVIGSISLGMSASRAAILGLLLAMPILVHRFGKRALLAYGIGAVIALALGLTVFRNVAHDPSENASRIAVWRGAARMAQRFALVGVGPLAFSVAYPFYKMPDVQVDEVHAHDLPLNVLIENGLLGLGAFVFAVLACVRAARAAGGRIEPHDRERWLVYSGLATAFAASAVQNSVDLVTTFVFLLWWPMMGLTLSLGAARDD